jgi:predicted DNA-binding transcriptional regulator AlpA
MPTHICYPTDSRSVENRGISESQDRGLPQQIKKTMQKVSEPSTRTFLSVEEVSQSFGVSRKSIYRLLDRGLLKSSNALRHKMILKRSVDEFVANTVNNGGAR